MFAKAKVILRQRNSKKQSWKDQNFATNFLNEKAKLKIMVPVNGGTTVLISVERHVGDTFLWPKCY